MQCRLRSPHRQPDLLSRERRPAYMEERMSAYIWQASIFYSPASKMDFPGGSDSKASATMRETWVQSLGREDPPEKDMATHSSILAWKIPWTEEPGRLQSMGSQRLGHD